MLELDPSKWAEAQASLKGVHPRLLAVLDRVHLAGVPFVVVEGVRSAERQRALVAAGKSRRTDSRHLTGHAVDIAPPLPSGKPSWSWPDYFPLAQAVRLAVLAEGVDVVWGGCWDRSVADLVDMREARDAYAARYRKAHPPYRVAGVLHTPQPLLDGPHWELSDKAFPA